MKLHKIVVSPDSFKESLSAKEVAEICSKKILERIPDGEIISVPIADGGEGTLEIFSDLPGYEIISCEISGPLFEKIDSRFLYNSHTKEAIIESALVCGLNLVGETGRNPLFTTSSGLGEMILKCIEEGSKIINIFLGGTSTHDGGMGMLSALGYEFLDADGKELQGKGENLIKVKRISLKKDPRLDAVSFRIFSDVNNILLGKENGSIVFAPQKGARPENIELLEQGMKNFSNRIIELTHSDLSREKGAGAAGGIAYALLSCLNSEIESGIEYILKTLDYDSIIKDADLILTGEGRIDRQSVGMGKALGGVIDHAKKYGIPVVGLAGSLTDLEEIETEFKALFSIQTGPLNLEKALNKENASRNLSFVTGQIINLLQT